MSKQNNSIDYYTERTAEITVSFPEDYIHCQYCRFMDHTYATKTYHCLVTRELILYPFDAVGDECPFGYNGQRDA